MCVCVRAYVCVCVNCITLLIESLQCVRSVFGMRPDSFWFPAMHMRLGIWCDVVFLRI